MGDVQGSANRLFLIRHGETVDNVTGLYAGFRDSALTNHGYQQAVRLGKYFADARVVFTHVFSSDLSRAFMTAEAVRTAQLAARPDEAPIPALQTVPLKDLRERNFGFYEGKPFYAPQSISDREEPGFEDMESMATMTARANAFIDGHLFPLINNADQNQNFCVAVVSHVTLDPKLPETMNMSSLEHLGSWGNTSYLELELHRLPESFKSAPGIFDDDNPTESRVDSQDPANISKETSSSETDNMSRFSMLIKVVQGRDHLKGLKRTGGGVGSSKFDEGQKKIESFFQSQKPS